MTDADFTTFSTALAIAAETLDAPISELRIRGYFERLKDLPLEPVVAVLNRAGRWLPKPDEIRDAIAGTTEDAADIAWGDVLTAIRHVGRYGDPRAVLTPQAHAAMLATFGSWGEACNLSNEGPERQGYAKQFRAVYGAQQRRTSSQALTVEMLPEGLRQQARALIGGER